ncbi:MAG: hypothetical protein RJA76_257 [Bacteroidota bacterium]|jgi:O-antigen/teichoic acid export membrane protein
MSVLKKLAGETLSYGFSTILGRSLNFLLVLVHTKAFSPSELGINVKLYSYIAIANILYTYGMETAYFRYAKENPEKYYRLILSAIIGSTFVFTAMLFGLAGPIMTNLGYAGQEQFLYWIALILAIDTITAIPFARLRLEQKTKKFVTAKIFSIFINIGLNLLFLMVFKPIHEGTWGQELQEKFQALYNPLIGAGYIFLANLIANLSFFIWLKDEFKDFKWYWDREEIKKLFIYAFPIMFMSLAAMSNLMFDRLLLEELLPHGFYPGRTSQEALGIYGNCYKLSIFMSLAIQAFKYAAEPFFLGRVSKDNTKTNLALVTHWFIIVCLFLWVGVSNNLFWLKSIFLKRPIYWEGIGIIPVLLLANLFLGVYYNISVWFKLKDKTYLGTIITLIGFACTIAGNVFFIPIYGYIACAYSFLGSAFVMTFLCLVAGQKYDPAPYKVISALFYILLGGVVILTPNLFESNVVPKIITQNIGILFLGIFVILKEFSIKNGKVEIKFKP